MQKNYLPEIQSSQSANHYEAKVKAKIHSPNSSIEWEQLINTSIPNSVKAQLIPKGSNAINLSKLAPTSDISYLRSTKRNFAKLGQSIYKDPELQQTKYDKNMQSFYSTLYRKSSARIPFNTNLEKEQFSGHLLDFGEIFQDNKKATGLQRYFGEILKLDLQQTVQEKEMVPPNRQQACDLRDWLFMMIAYTKQESSNMTTRELAERIQLIYASCLRELIKQVGIECAERGELLQTVWDFYVELIGQIIKCSSEQFKESEKSYIEQMTRIQNFHESQMENANKQYKQFEAELQRVKDEQLEGKDEQNMTKAKMLLLTADMRQLIQTNENQKNEIDSLLLQILLLKTSDNQNQEKKDEHEQITMKFTPGHSIVSHLLNFSSPNAEYKFKKNKVKNSNFEKFESLKQQEQMLKSDLINQQILEPDIEYADQEQQTHELLLEEKEIQTEIGMIQLEEQQSLIEKQLLEMQQIQENNEKLTENQQLEQARHSMIQLEQQQKLEERLLEAITLIQESEIDSKEQICETITLQLKKSQQLSQKLINLEKEETLQKVELMEKEDVNEELESKLAQAVQDFIEIIKKKKGQIKKLIKQKSNLQETLNHIKSTYNIEINEEIIEEEKDYSVAKSRDQSSEFQQEGDNSQGPKEFIDEQDELNYQLTDRSKIKESEEPESRAKKQLRMLTKTNENNDSAVYIQNSDDTDNKNEIIEQQQIDQRENISLEQENDLSPNQRETSEDQKLQTNSSINNSQSNQTLKMPQQQSSSRNLQKQQKQNLQIQQNSTFKKRQQQSLSQRDSSRQLAFQQNQTASQQQLQQHSIQSQSQISTKQQSNSQMEQQQIQQNQQENLNQVGYQQSPTIKKRQNLGSEKQLSLNQRNNQKQSAHKHSILEKTNQQSFQELDDNDSSGNQNTKKRNSQQPEFKNRNKLGQQEKGYIHTQNELDQTQQSEDFDIDSPNMEFGQQNQGNHLQGDRVKSLVLQYKDQKHKIRNRYNPIVLEPKNQKRYKRVYSQNTDIANSLLNEVKSKKKPGKKISFSVLQLQKLVTQILSDICKQSEGYKIPFHVSIYDYYKNKYGFKQVAEKKIRQVYQFIYFEKENHIKTKLLAQFCYLIGEMDEIGQKLLAESFQFFSARNDLNYSKVELMLNYEAVNEFLTEKASVWLQQQQIQQLLQQYRSSQQSNQRYYVNHDSFLIKILEFYTNNKKDQQTILESLFKAADLDGNNLIEFSEFKTLYRAIHPDKVEKGQLIQIFTNNADFQDENGDKMLTLPRFTEMSIELGIFQKELVLKYGEGMEELKNNWEREKTNIKYRFLRAKKFQKVRHTFLELDNQINHQEKNKQVILWVSYKLLNEESQRVLLNYETKQCLMQLMPELYVIQQHSKAIEQLE